MNRIKSRQGTGQPSTSNNEDSKPLDIDDLLNSTDDLDEGAGVYNLHFPPHIHIQGLGGGGGIQDIATVNNLSNTR